MISYDCRWVLISQLRWITRLPRCGVISARRVNLLTRWNMIIWPNYKYLFLLFVTVRVFDVIKMGFEVLLNRGWDLGTLCSSRSILRIMFCKTPQNSCMLAIIFLFQWTSCQVSQLRDKWRYCKSPVPGRGLCKIRRSSAIVLRL